MGESGFQERGNLESTEDGEGAAEVFDGGFVEPEKEPATIEQADGSGNRHQGKHGDGKNPVERLFVFG